MQKVKAVYNYFLDPLISESKEAICKVLINACILQNKIYYIISSACLLADTHVPQFTIEMQVADRYI